LSLVSSISMILQFVFRLPVSRKVRPEGRNELYRVVSYPFYKFCNDFT